MQHSDKRTELATALVLNGHIPATILDEVAELMGLEDGEGDGSHSSQDGSDALSKQSQCLIGIMLKCLSLTVKPSTPSGCQV